MVTMVTTMRYRTVTAMRQIFVRLDNTEPGALSVKGNSIGMLNDYIRSCYSIICPNKGMECSFII